MAEKIHSTVFYFLCVKKNLLTSSEHVKATPNTLKIINNHPPLSNIKGREALATWNVSTRHFSRRRSRGKCIKRPNQIKTELCSTHLVTAIAFRADRAERGPRRGRSGPGGVRGRPFTSINPRVGFATPAVGCCRRRINQKRRQEGVRANLL